MKKSVTYIYIILSLMLIGCNSDNPPIEEEEVLDYIVINDIEQSLVLYGSETFYAYKGFGPFDFDGQTGKTTSLYYTLNIVDPNHEIGGNFTPNYIKYLVLRFLVKPNHTSGIYTTTLNDSATLNQGEVVTECIIDNKTSIQADPNQKISIIITEKQKVIEFTDVIYGSNKISGKFIMRN